MLLIFGLKLNLIHFKLLTILSLLIVYLISPVRCLVQLLIERSLALQFNSCYLQLRTPVTLDWKKKKNPSNSSSNVQLINYSEKLVVLLPESLKTISPFLLKLEILKSWLCLLHPT